MQLEVFTKKIFLIRTGEIIFFDMVKKYTIFVQKFITQKNLQNTKKFCTMKKFNILAFQRYKIFYSNSRNNKVMVKTKKLAERGLFFVLNCISFQKCFYLFVNDFCVNKTQKPKS